MTILIVTAGFIIVAFVGALFYGIEYAFHASYPYQFAVQRKALHFGHGFLGNQDALNSISGSPQIHRQSRRKSEYLWMSVGSF